MRPLHHSPLLLQVSAVHLSSHLHIMTLPVMLPLLPAQMGVGFVELGVAIGVFNVVSALVQTPMGFAVDRFGARRVLLAGLLLGSLGFLSLSVAPHYLWLLVAMAMAGVANGVYHPGDYALLSQGIDESRMGRAFSIHTFSGYLGSALAPALLLGVAALAGPSGAFAAAGLVGLAAAAFMATGAMPASSAPRAARPKPAPAAGGKPAALLTPAVASLTLLFVLLNLSTSALQSFSVSALVAGHGTPLALANTGLTAFLFSSAFGVLAGGFVADRTRRHGAFAALAFGLAALLVLTLGNVPLSGLWLVLTLGLAGFFTGIIAPSRDMLVRAASPKGAEGRVFGIVSTGFNIGGAVGPIFFGWLLDRGQPLLIFQASFGFMLLVVVVTLLQEWRSARLRHAPAPQAASRA